MKTCTASFSFPSSCSCCAPTPSPPSDLLLVVSARAWLIVSSMLGMTEMSALGSSWAQRSAKARWTVSFLMASGSYWWLTKSVCFLGGWCVDTPCVSLGT